MSVGASLYDVRTPPRVSCSPYLLAVTASPSWNEHELSGRRRALQQLVRAAHFGERQALRHDRLDLAATKQPEQREEVLPKPLRVAVAQLVDPVAADAPAGREQAPQKDARGLRVPLGPRAPAPAPLRERGGVAEHDKPSARPQRTEGANRRRATEPVEHNVDASPGEAAHPRQEILVSVVDRGPRRAARPRRGREPTRSRRGEARPALRARGPPCPPCRPRRARAPPPRSSPSPRGEASGRRSCRGGRG